MDIHYAALIVTNPEIEDHWVEFVRLDAEGDKTWYEAANLDCTGHKNEVVCALRHEASTLWSKSIIERSLGVALLSDLLGVDASWVALEQWVTFYKEHGRLYNAEEHTGTEHEDRRVVQD